MPRYHRTRKPLPSTLTLTRRPTQDALRARGRAAFLPLATAAACDETRALVVSVVRVLCKPHVASGQLTCLHIEDKADTPRASMEHRGHGVRRAVVADHNVAGTYGKLAECQEASAGTRADLEAHADGKAEVLLVPVACDLAFGQHVARAGVETAKGERKPKGVAPGG